MRYHRAPPAPSSSAPLPCSPASPAELPFPGRCVALGGESRQLGSETGGVPHNEPSPPALSIDSRASPSILTTSSRQAPRTDSVDNPFLRAKHVAGPAPSLRKQMPHVCAQTEPQGQSRLPAHSTWQKPRLLQKPALQGSEPEHFSRRLAMQALNSDQQAKSMQVIRHARATPEERFTPRGEEAGIVGTYTGRGCRLTIVILSGRRPGAGG